MFLGSMVNMGGLVELTDEHFKYLNPVIDKPNRVEKKDKPVVLLEVHLYTKDSSGNAGDLAMPLSSFNRLDVYSFDEKKARNSKVLFVIDRVASVTILAVFISVGTTLYVL